MSVYIVTIDLFHIVQEFPPQPIYGSNPGTDNVLANFIHVLSLHFYTLFIFEYTNTLILSTTTTCV